MNRIKTPTIKTKVLATPMRSPLYEYNGGGKQARKAKLDESRPYENVQRHALLDQDVEWAHGIFWIEASPRGIFRRKVLISLSYIDRLSFRQ